MITDDFYQLGRIIKPHGYKGDISIKLDVDYPEHYQKMESVFVLMNDTLIPFFFTKYRPQSNPENIIAHVEGTDDEAGAKMISGCELYLPLNQLPKLEGNQFYFHEVIGWSVVDQELGLIGTVKAITENGPHPIMEIDAKGKEVLLPVVDSFFLGVNRETQSLEVNTPEGLVEFYRDA